MSSEDETTVSELQNRAIPALLTTSLRFVLEEFGDQIVTLSAGGSVEGRNTTVLDREYGLQVDQPGKTELSIEYEQRRDSDGEIQNPLTDEKVEEIIAAVDDTLGPVEDRTGRQFEPDLAVNSVTIEVTNEALQEAANTTTDTFELHFESDRAEEAVRDQTRFLNRDRGLYKQGHKIHNLNLHTLYESAEKFGDNSPDRIVDWRGPSDVHPKAPRAIAATILGFLPREYRHLKIYGVGQENRLVLLNGEEDYTDNDQLAGLQEAADD